MRRRAKLDFERNLFLTNIDDAEFARVLPIIHEYMPRIHISMSETGIRAYINAILYLSTFYSPWRKIKKGKSINRFYHRLRRRGALGVIQRALGRNTTLQISRPRKKHVDKGREKCPPCPRCHAGTMICYGTVKSKNGEGTVIRITRYARCKECGHTSVWVSTSSHTWWKNPYQGKNLPTYC